MGRLAFLRQMLVSILSIVLPGPPEAQAADDDDFSMTGATLVGEANGTHGA